MAAGGREINFITGFCQVESTFSRIWWKKNYKQIFDFSQQLCKFILQVTKLDSKSFWEWLIWLNRCCLGILTVQLPG